MPPIDVEPDQHALVVGVNGCGKSTLATVIAERAARVLVLDSKGMDPAALISNAHVAHGRAEALRALRGGAARLVYRPTREEMAFYAPGRRLVGRYLDELLEVAWRRGGCFRVVVHEIGDVASEDYSEPVLDETIRKGRFFELSLIACTQTPNRIPYNLRSEAKHVFVFALLDEGHRRVVGQYAGAAARDPLPMDRSFLHRGPDMVLRHYPPLDV